MMFRLSSAFVFEIAKTGFIFLIYNFSHIILLKKKHLDCLRGGIMTHLRKFVSSVPKYCRTSRRTSNTNLKTYSCLSYWGGLASVLPELKWYFCLCRTGVARGIVPLNQSLNEDTPHVHGQCRYRYKPLAVLACLIAIITLIK